MRNIANGKFFIRPVEKKDNPSLEQIIVQVLKEYGAEGEGFACADPETKAMYEAYQPERRAYLVVTDAQGKVVGGAGFAALLGGSKDVCEFQKMYLLKEARGFGLGKILLEECLKLARQQGFRRCYLETLSNMDEAQALYLKCGFERIDGPMGDTGHFKIDRFYVRDLV
jgi:putative acetyltransferase